MMPPFSISSGELEAPVHTILPLLDSQFGLSTISFLHVAVGVEDSMHWLWFQRHPIMTLKIASSNFVELLDILGQESVILSDEATADHENPSSVQFSALSTLILQSVSFIHFADYHPRFPR